MHLAKPEVPNGQSSFKTWLLALIRNTAVDEWRRKKRQLVLSSGGEARIEQPAPGAGPDETLHRLEIQNLLAEALFPPELVMQHQSDIGLTHDQREALMSSVRQAHERFGQMHERLQKEVEALGALLKEEQVDEKAALAQFDKVQTQERDIKRAHLELVIGLKNNLTAEQQGKLQEFKKQMIEHGPSASLRHKVEKIKEGVEDWQSSGRDPSRIGEIMQEFEPLMRAGELKEAEAVLDRALKVLREGEKENGEDKSANPQKK